MPTWQWIGAQKVIAAPQIEAPLTPVSNPYVKAKPEGFGATARWWMPRVALQGNYDDAWRKTRYPLLPKDFDAHFFQCAAPDLIAMPHLLGDETVTLLGLLPERRDMRLPEWKVLVAATLASGKVTIMPLSLDTLRFDLQTQQASLVWRTHFRYDDPVVELAIGMTTLVIGARPAP